MSIRRKTWIAVSIEFVSLAGLGWVFVRGGPVLIGWALLAAFEMALVCSLYFLAQWRDELTR